jgi:hypothetical protein
MSACGRSRFARRFELLVVVTVVAMLARVQAAAAQSITGIVVLPDSVTPASRVIVVASDASGATAGRALTGDRGQFTLRLPGVGSYQITLLRIGFRPTRFPPVVVGATSEAPVRFVLANQPVRLSLVNVRERETCRVSADTGFVVTRVWEEARKAMLTTQLVADDAPLYAEWIEYDRGLDSTFRVVMDQRIRTSRSPTTHAFKSRPAAELDSIGYIVSDTSGTTFYAPDADVLLSETFARAHCFHLVEAPRSVGFANPIGVAFEPTRDRREKYDIQGTLWLDRESAELKSLEFHYTHVPDVVAVAEPGGRVEFLRLSDGHWLVSRWSVRMPRVGTRTRAPQIGTGRIAILAPAAGLTAQVARVSGVQITGGEVTRVTRHDTVVYEATGPSVIVQVSSRDPALRASTPWLTLDGTDYSALGSKDGVLRVSPVLDGRYRARVSVPLMDSLGMPPVEREVEARVDSRADTVRLPTSHDIVLAACSRDSVKNGEGMVYGRVRDEHGALLRGAAVTATWRSYDARSGHDGAYGETTLGALTTDDGYWRICGVPRNLQLAIHVVSDSGVDARELRLDDPQSFVAIDLVARRMVADAKDSAAATSNGRALVEISVNQLAGPALSDVTVEVIASGRTRRVVTGATGRALIPDVTPGVLTVRARRIGYKQGELAVRVEAGRNTIPILLSSADLPTLDTVRVVGSNRLAGIRRNDEFEMRRQFHQSTVSFTEEDIKKRNVVDIWQMLSNVPSIRVVDSGKVTIESTRSNNVNPDGSQSKCYMQVMVDGILMRPLPGDAGLDLRMLPKPNEIHGVEVFAGPSMIPLQYGGTGSDKWCGLIAIWTK